ncbi:uracil-xanthine permease family protein [Sansalvadorimonas sp. 2012CJ34-2]|uniref:Uracil-xanthine permease family protein n=1 Tax=Parendozoicomonas callyspongiae TaxID=2942213 RepID=A0ABT0PC33_9GAMM|nr:uracil-xanthine permease family protein [Sansalvadorimonas sp. 2012CJ34-2]MCL6268944.1 uracil-xanthine permease family protein [Sansalvadorimonas sp. 2012CJ34-2]
MDSENHFKIALVGGQMLFVAFGALVLVPLLTGFDPNVALFTAGVGTLVFQFCTQRRVPLFLGSSFAFIAPIIYSVETWGMPATLGGIMAGGGFYLFLSLMVRLYGRGFLYRLFPPVVVGPVIMVIGLGLSTVAVNMAMGKTGDGSSQIFEQEIATLVAGAALLTTLAAATMGRGLIRLVPILAGVCGGMLAAWFTGICDFSKVTEIGWLTVPPFVFPEWNMNAVLFMLPVAVAPAIEHLGDILAISSVAGEDYMESPGLHRTLLGDGLATSLAAAVGGPPNTTYSEVTGAVMLTKVINPATMTWAAIVAITLAFVGRLGAVLNSIPSPVTGGILVLLFGSISVVGLNTLIKSRVNLSAPRNLCIVSLSLVFGLGGLQIGTSFMALQGVSLTALTAVALNLILPEECQHD